MKCWVVGDLVLGDFVIEAWSRGLVLDACVRDSTGL